MDMLTAIASLIFVAAITPGPNNLLVFRTAAHHGLPATLPAIGGVIVGGLVILALLQLGLGSMLDRHAWLAAAVVLLGALYLGWMGLALAFSGAGHNAVALGNSRPVAQGAWTLFSLQFVNPKTWTMLLTVAALAQAAAGAGHEAVPFVSVAALFVALSFVSLMTWTVMGRLAARGLKRGSVLLYVDRAMGLLLVAMAGLMCADLAEKLSDGAA